MILARRWRFERHNLPTLVLAFFLAFVTQINPAHSDTTKPLWDALKNGTAVVLIRHALAPGTGDPGNFDINDCSTQRNLSDTGRAQSDRMGDLFRANGISTARVLSSQWCRCMETAELMNLGPVDVFLTINSFFRNRSQSGPQTRALIDWINNADLSTPTIFVTHQVNITALTDIFPSSGELVFVGRDDKSDLSVLGTIETD